jgi:hypothetical protein
MRKARCTIWVHKAKVALPLYPQFGLEPKVALPLYPQFGLEPNVYYIPPRWVPRGYLQQMFGPGVDAAIQAYAKPSHELLGLLQLFGTTQSILASYTITANEAIGYDARAASWCECPSKILCTSARKRG